MLPENRFGRVFVDTQTIRNNPTLALQLMANMVVVRCERHFQPDRLEYLAWSPFFEALEQGSETPEYTITSHQPRNGNVQFLFHRKD